MTQKSNIITFIDEIYSNPSRKNNPTDKIIYSHFDEIWSIDLAELSDYKTLAIKKFEYMFIMIDKFSKFLWYTPLENKNSITIAGEFSIILTKSKRKSFKLEYERGKEWFNFLFQNLLRS